MGYVYLLIAIVCEVVATSALKATEGFTKLGPSMIVVAGYSICFYFLSLVQKYIPVGVSYAIWSGVGIILISIAGFILYNQKLDFPAIVGIAFIIIGVIILQVFSSTTAL